MFSGGGTTAAVGSSGTLSIGSSAHNTQQLYDKIDRQEKVISQQSAEIKVLKEKLNQMLGDDPEFKNASNYEQRQIAEYKLQQTPAYKQVKEAYDQAVKNRKQKIKEAFEQQYKPEETNNVQEQTIPKFGATGENPYFGLFNKGGMTMEQQMSLFQEGGMKDDGMDVDPVSGNDVPPGSLAKEVRDDIPAQLSEGEYVVPADVVQYYGVKFFEDLRMEAKRGLAEMDATGRIGGEPMSMTMIAIGGAEEEQKERQKKALGGIVGFDNGGGVSKDMAEVQKYGSFNPYNFSVVGGTPFSPIARTGQSMGITTGDTHSKMFYHPDGRVQAVPGKMVTVNGKQKFLPNTQYAEFTESPWSDTPPSQAKAQETQAPKEDREDKNRSPFDAEAQRLQNENSLKISADRLKIPLETYAKLSIGKRFKLMGEEFKAMRGNEVDRDKINAILEDEDTGFDLSSVTKLLGGLVASFTGNPLIAVGARILGGILSGDDTDDAPTTSPSTVRSSGSSGPVATSTVFDSLAQASKAGFHGQNVNIKGKGVQKVEFADPKFDAAMKKESSDREDKSEARKKLAENIKSSRAGTQTGSTSQTTTSVKEDDFSKYPGVPDELNKGGLINKPKRNPKKPRGKGLGNRK